MHPWAALPNIIAAAILNTGAKCNLSPGICSSTGTSTSIATTPASPPTDQGGHRAICGILVVNPDHSQDEHAIGLECEVTADGHDLPLTRLLFRDPAVGAFDLDLRGACRCEFTTTSTASEF
jgi:hypothetical protein